MIGLVSGLLLFQAVPAAQPSFAFTCHLNGTLSESNKETPLPKRRPLFFMVQGAGGGSFTPLRTFDPSSVLNGRQVRIFQGYDEKTKGYKAFTGVPSEDAGSSVILLVPSESKTHNEWTVGIRALAAGPGSTLTVGSCLLMDGISEPEFEDVVKYARAKINSKGELE